MDKKPNIRRHHTGRKRRWKDKTKWSATAYFVVAVALILVASCIILFMVFRTNLFITVDELQLSHLSIKPNDHVTTIREVTEDIVDDGQIGEGGEGEGTEPGDSTGGGSNLEATDVFTPIRDTGLEGVGNKTAEYITVATGKNLYLYDGLPWNCADVDGSYLLTFEKIEEPWREFYKSNVGNDYPNRVHYADVFHSDTNDHIYTDYGVSGANYIWNYDGVDVMGLVIPPFWYTHEFGWEGMMNQRADCTAHRYALVLEKGGQYYYAPAIASGGKGHNWPGRCYQTYISRGPGDILCHWCQTGQNAQSGTTDQAIAALESGVAGAAYGSNANTVVQCTIEAFVQEYANSLNGFHVYGVIIYSNR